MIELAKGSEAEVYMGYDGSLERQFVGYLGDRENMPVNEFVAKDLLVLLETSMTRMITCTFYDVNADDVIKYVLGKCGITAYKLALQPTQRVGNYLIKEKSGRSALAQIAEDFGITEGYYSRGGIFYWGGSSEQVEVKSLEYGKNIIRMFNTATDRVFETAMVPGLFHSDKIDIKYPGYNGVFTVKKVRHSSVSGGFVHTFIHV